jgi:DNA-binding CsgD family transcriptional regulator
MSGWSYSRRETALIRDIVEATRGQSDMPLPWLVLEQLKELLNADCVTFLCLDSSVPRLVFEQFIEPWDEHGCAGETAEEAESNPFWTEYWGPRGCSYPDLSGNYRYVRRASDHLSLRERREMLAARGSSDPVGDRYLEACLPGRSSGRYLRLGAHRAGRDFAEKDVLSLELLQPHIERAFWAGAAAHRDVDALTGRQLEILRMVKAGLTNRQIARRAGVSEGTVHVHLTNIFDRLGVRSRTAAVEKAFRTTEDWSLTPSANEGAS